MKKKLLSFALAFASLACFGQAFIPGNLLVVRSGDSGAAPVAGTYSTIYLDEYNSSGTLVNTHAISGLVGDGTSTNEGYYQLSPNGMYLAVGGYAKNVGDTRTINTSATGDLAKIQIYGVTGTSLKTYTLPAGVFSNGDSGTSGQVINSRFTGTVALNDGTGAYAGGGSIGLSYGGVFYVNNNLSTGNLDVFNQIQTTQSNLRVPGIFAGQLFASGNAAALGDATGVAIRLGAFNSALPTTASGSTISNLQGADFSVTVANGGVPVNICQYVVFDADATIPGYDVLLVTDDGSTAGRKGVIKKYVKNGSGNWILKYELFTGSSNIDATNNYKFRGLVSSVNSGNNVSFYATAFDPVNAIYKVVKFTDADIFTSTTAPSWSTIITAPSANYIFKGISLTPGRLNLVLPLKLTSFRGSLKLKTVDLNWTTASEVNTSHFDVERSLDGKNFEKIGTVKTKNITGNNSYSFTDKADFSGTVYYRLKMVDLDESVTTSDLVAVKNIDLQEFTVYPNPASNKLNISFEQVQIPGTIQVIQTDGKVVLTQKINVGLSKSSLNISSLTNGLYIVRMDINNKTISRNFVKN